MVVLLSFVKLIHSKSSCPGGWRWGEIEYAVKHSRAAFAGLGLSFIISVKEMFWWYNAGKYEKYFNFLFG